MLPFLVGDVVMYVVSRDTQFCCKVSVLLQLHIHSLEYLPIMDLRQMQDVPQFVG